MMPKLRNALVARRPHWSAACAAVRGTFSRARLPPGSLVRLDELEKSDRRFLLRRAQEVGPVFKAIAWNELWICVVGLPLGRRLLREHGEHLKPVTLKLEALFPKGFLRQMQGEDHRKYRKALVRAIRPEDLAANRAGLDAIATRGLADYAARQPEHRGTPEAYISTLNAIASGMLIQTFFGARLGTAAFDRLLDSYRELGPFGLVWNLGPRQERAFAAIRDYLTELFAGSPEQHPPGSQFSILGRLHGDGAVDATLLGNLIYMVEMGRYDTYSLFRWLTKYAAENPALLERIAGEDAEAPAGGRSLAEAFVLETLRMDQSERLIRRAQRDIVFDGHLIPKHSTVRVCLWESHKSPDAFPEPFRFDPARFLGREPTGDQFAPFGLDHHQCPLGGIAIDASMIFLRALARGYRPAPIADGLPVRGAYHWEPASQFGVRLEPRVAPDPDSAP